MSLDNLIDMGKLKEEESTSFLPEQPASITSHHNSFEGKKFPDKEASKIQILEETNQLDAKFIMPGTDKRETFQKEDRDSCQSSYSSNKEQKKLHNICISISSSSDEEEDSPSKKKPMLHARCAKENDVRQMPVIESHYELSSDVELPDLADVPLVVTREHIPNEKDETAESQQEQEIRNKNKEKVSKGKNTTKSNRSRQPLQCIHLDIDHCVLGLKNVEHLWTSLQSVDISYSLSSNAVNFSILWQREVNCEVSENDKEANTVEKYPEDYVMIIFTADSFIELVQGFKLNSSGRNGTNSILDHASYHKTLFPGKNITYALIGVDRYFRDMKNQKNRKYKSVARGSANENAIEDFLMVSFDDVEEVTVCLQIHEGIICHMVDTMNDLAALIVSFSKGIAEAPEKRQSRQNTFSWYAEGDTYKGVKVSNLNESLLQLWHQQIQQFSLVSKEVADAIISHYPSPRLLVEAYKSHTTEKGEKLLKDIVIRRGVGPLVTMKRVGPELSRKIYHFFTKEDESILV